MFEVPNWKVTHFIKKPIKLSILALRNVSVSHTASQVGIPTNANIVTSLHCARL